MSITFEVDDVTPAPMPAATVSLRELVGEHAVLGGNPELRVLPDATVHPLIGAVHYAFVDHRPLVLTPDAVWLTILQGVAQHVRINAEALRPRLVRHAGKQVLEVARTALPDGGADWSGVIAAFRRALGDKIGEGRARLLTCDFSTTTETERIASEVVLMDAMSPYYDYLVTIVCGIPTITLRGTPEDWRSIRARIDVIAELELASWTRSLAVIADRLVAASAGQPDREFFRRIYKPRSAYGWDRVTGWIARLYPYIQSGRGDFTAPNPLLELSVDHEEPEGDGYFSGAGIRTCDPPPGASRVLVRVVSSLPGSAIELVTVEGGLLAIEHTDDGKLVPRAGYVVRATRGIELAIERLRSAHGATPGDASAGAPWHHDARLRTLFESIGSASIQTGSSTWRLVPASERTRILVARGRYGALVVTRVMDLADGTILALTEQGHVVRLRTDRISSIQHPIDPTPDPDDEIRFGGAADDVEAATDERAENIHVIAPSLIELLGRATAGNASLASSTSLLDILPSWWDSAYHAAPLVERLRRGHRVVDSTDGGGLFDSLAELAVSIGDSTWRTFVPPPEWGRATKRNIQLQASVRWAQPKLDLGDGTILAVLLAEEPRVVRLECAAIRAEPVRKKIIHLSSSQPAESIPVLGRSLVDVLGFALDHRRLPDPVDSVAALSSWGRAR